jgi:GPH family glycoside/pentoside/hexuronide:cation symporter
LVDASATAFTSASTPNRRLPLWRQLGWAVGDTGINFYWGMLNTFLFFFYTDIMGISPGWAGIAFAIASVWDAVTDPAMGAIVDRTNTRFGRFRPFILAFSLPCALSFALMFWTPGLEGGWLVAYAVATHVLFRTFFTGVSIPFTSLAGILTPDSDQRSWLASFRIVFAAIGSLTVAYTVPKFLEIYDDQKFAFLAAASGLGVLATAILLVTFFATKGVEGAAVRAPQVDQPSIFHQIARDVRAFWSILIHNRPLAVLFASVIVGSIMLTMSSKGLIYWVKYDLEDLSVLGWLLPLGAFVVMAASPVWAKASQLLSKRTVTWIGAGLLFASSASFWIVNPRNAVVLGVISAIGSAGAAAKYVMYWSMLPDTVEYNAYKTGERSDAKIFGFAAFAQKVALAVNALVFGWLLSATGFAPDQPQTEETKSAILGIMCFIPMAGAAISSILIWFYPIDAKYHAEIRARLVSKAAA